MWEYAKTYRNNPPELDWLNTNWSDWELVTILPEQIHFGSTSRTLYVLYFKRLIPNALPSS